MTQKLEAAFSALTAKPTPLSAQPTVTKAKRKPRTATQRNPAPVTVRKVAPAKPVPSSKPVAAGPPDLSDMDAYSAYWANWRKEKGLE